MSSDNYIKKTSLLIICMAVLLSILALVVDLIGGDFPILANKFNTKILIGEIVITIAAITLIPTYIVSYLKSSIGELEFSALGINVKGKAAPILYWLLLFISVSAVVLTLFSIFQPRLG